MENMQVMFAFIVCILLTVVNCSEPMCSTFDYQEQLLEKMIRTEIKVETMEESIKTTQTEVINVLKSLQIDIKTELNKTQLEIKDQLETFSGEMKKHDGEIASFKEENYEKINTAISTMDTSFQQMEGQIGRMSADLVELQNKTVTRLTETLSGDRKKFENEITSLRQESYDKINTAISTMDTSSQQMEGQIGRMSADLVELQNVTVTRLTDQVVTPNVVFKARSVVDKSPETGQTLVFSTSILNEGGGYDSSTGIFTAPVSGLYLFTVQFCTLSGKYINFAMIVDDQPTTLSSMGDKGYYVCSSADTTAVMTRGMQAWIKCTLGSSSDILHEGSYRLNTFSGLLVHK